MKLKLQKRLASDLLNCSPHRIKFDTDRLEDIKEAITRVDIRGLVKEGAIMRKKTKGIAKYRSRKIKLQKKKGRQKGHGSRKGTFNARLQKKRTWINTIRKQRELLKILMDKQLISKKTHHELYNRTKGGFFRSRRHLRLYIEEHHLIKK